MSSPADGKVEPLIGSSTSPAAGETLLPIPPLLQSVGSPTAEAASVELAAQLLSLLYGTLLRNTIGCSDLRTLL